MPDALPIAGWYPDPEYPGHDRWWDGGTWGEQRRPSAGAAVSPPAAAAAPGHAGLYIPGEAPMAAPPAPAYAPAPIQRNTLAIVGFILSMSGLVLPFVLNSLAGGIVSIIALRHARSLPGHGVVSTGRGLSIAGILVGFIWGGLCLLFIAGWILLYFWFLGTAQNFQYPDAPVA